MAVVFEVIVTFMLALCALCIINTQAKRVKADIPDEKWNYVKVRDNAFMFWWLYGAQTDPAQRVDKPLIMWLQGGPGGSSTGFGNFKELGPLDVNLRPRNTSWTSVANVLFVDNPVGSGFSYVTDDSAFTTNVSGIQ
jgi:serine carboxypeptidase 1